MLLTADFIWYTSGYKWSVISKHGKGWLRPLRIGQEVAGDSNPAHIDFGCSLEFYFYLCQDFCSKEFIELKRCFNKIDDLVSPQPLKLTPASGWIQENRWSQIKYNNSTKSCQVKFVLCWKLDLQNQNECRKKRAWICIDFKVFILLYLFHKH